MGYVLTAEGIGKNPSVVYWLNKTLYLNITNRCTNNCYFCLRRFKTGIAGFNLKLKDEPPSNRIINVLQNVLNRRHWKEIVFCGFGEPTTRLDTLLEVACWINKTALKPVRIDTNGHAFLLYPKRDVVNELKKAGVSKLSVSLNAHNETIYNEVCQPKFENAFDKVLEFVEQVKDKGFNVEVTAVTIPEIEISAVEKLASDMKVQFRARQYLPFIW
ncbi:MAG: TatD family nuclease-associated radical SAM protein [Candidatus Bathyarchaeia archaeon]